MRPHQLTIRALGPYADKVEIDFDHLMRAGTFLIHGTTGAGKTFLLDAMCFALYGEVPGERGKHTLRSQHASASTDSVVVLEFSAQGRRWRIERTPAYERPKRHGDGTTHVAATAGLWVKKGGEWQAVGSKIDDVTDQVNGVVGLDARRFQQVIMLPQGRFEQVLRSKSEDREELLRSLFDTSAFAGASEWLAERARRALDDVQEIECQAEALRDRASHEWASVATEAELVDQESFNNLVASCRTALTRAESDLDAASELASTDRDIHMDTQRLLRLWGQREGLLAKRSRVEAGQAEIDEMRRCVQANEGAEALRSLLSNADQSRDAERSARESVELASDELWAACASAPLLPPPCEAFPQSGAADEADWDAMRSSIEESRTTFAAHCEATREAHEAEAAALQARDREAECRDRESLHRAEAERAQERLASLSAELARCGAAAEGIDRLAERLAGIEKSASAARDLAGQRLDLEVATTAAQEATCRVLDRRDEAISLRERYVEGIASTLAVDLTDGIPCLVCGSEHHPAPAPTCAEVPDINVVREAEQAVEEARSLQDAAEATLRDSTARASRLEGEAGEFAGDPEAAERLVAEIRAELSEATECAHQSESVNEALQAVRRELAAFKASADQSSNDASAATGNAVAAEQAASTIRGRITADLGDVDPESALHGVEAVRTPLSRVMRMRRGLLEVEASNKTASEMLVRAIAESCFADESDARAALMEQADVTRARGLIEHHDTESTEVAVALTSDEFASLPAERPDADASRLAFESAEAAAREAAAWRALIGKAAKDISEWAAQHGEAIESLNTVRQQADLWATVSDRCNGKLSPKVSLQRWVLSAYLSEICDCANQRLATMTAGRYSLRVYGGTERYSAKAGLGLRVFDAHTGQEREVQTLSGGETFQASLALALGVADTVSRHSGGVRMETIFVDEGFGTLDAESLQMAMDELDRLREGGRVVGIISHIPGLRERIQIGIEITASERGSRARVGAVRAA